FTVGDGGLTDGEVGDRLLAAGLDVGLGRGDALLALRQVPVARGRGAALLVLSCQERRALLDQARALGAELLAQRLRPGPPLAPQPPAAPPAPPPPPPPL